MSNGLLRIYRNIWPITLALLVHLILLALISLNLDWTRQLKPAAMRPIQAVAIIEPIPLPEPKPKPVVLPEPVPEPEPIPEPPKPEPKPIKKIFSYPCAGRQLETDSEEKASALKAECDELERKKKAEVEKKKQKKLEEEKKHKAEIKKKEQEKAKKKKAAEKKKKAEVAAKKKKAAADKKKKADAAKKKKAEALKKKKAAAAAKKKKSAETARKKAAADAKRKRDAAAATARTEGEAGTAMQMAIGAIQAAVDSNWIQPRTSTIGLEVVVRVNIRPGGEVTSARVIKGSGNALFDRSAEIAILKASPLPIPSNPRYYPYIKEFDFRFRPNG